MLDWQMPGLNGFDVRERLARVDSEPPVVVITAYDERAARERARAAGARACLRKPFDEALFIATLHAAANRGASGEQASRGERLRIAFTLRSRERIVRRSPRPRFQP